MTEKPFLLWATSRGKITEDRSHHALARSGTHLVDLSPAALSPMPPGTLLHYLPDRQPQGRSRKTGRVEVVATRGKDAVRCLAVAAVLPNGWSRTLLPAYSRQPSATQLPFFGYTAVALVGEEVRVAALQTEDNLRWSPFQYATRDLPRLIRERLKEQPDNRLLRHHAHCAEDYQCYNAQNVFYRRWEAAIAVSAGCNSRCRGCISLQPEDRPPSPQARLDFVPSVDEIVAIGVPHLDTPEAILSFGQGCEGEPLLKADLIATAIRELRRRTERGTIHLNTNASDPEAVQKLIDAGLDSIRISLNSVHPERYRAYYVPQNYAFADVVEATRCSRAAGLQVALNLLFFPGLNDLEEEVEMLEAFVREHAVDQVQMRNLNIDPDDYLATQPPLGGRAIGIPKLVERLRGLCRVGNATAPCR